MDDIAIKDLKDLFLKPTPLIDVRAPVEFNAGSLPGAVNIPILDNSERAAVGTTYKREGSDAAMRLGHQLVSGATKDSRISQWLDYISANPTAVVFCFRGGSRSRITQRWLFESGVHRPLISGGFKRARQFLRDEISNFSSRRKLLLLSGPTGSKKTELLKLVGGAVPTFDLEAMARHRGSAFGATPSAQPSQIDFENSLAVEILRLPEASQKILCEDESRLIGRCAIPETLFARMRESELIYIDEPLELRIDNIFHDYVLKTPIGSADALSARLQFTKYRNATLMISKKLGGARTQEILHDLNLSESRFLADHKDIDTNKAWIDKLLRYYYDPLYSQNLKRRSPKIVMRGSQRAVADYINSIV